MLCGPTDIIAEARIWQRRHGGNLHTLAPNAIAAKIGMERHLPQIERYCVKASEIASALRGLNGLAVVPEYPPTNMMHLYFRGEKEALEHGLWTVAAETKILLVRNLWPTECENSWKVELTVTDTALDLDCASLREAMARALQLADSFKATT